MKPYLRRVTTAIAVASALITSGIAYGKDCKDITKVDSGACPLLVGGAPVFDRCFGSFPGDAKVQQVPNSACDALRDTKKTADALARSVSAYLGDAQQDLERARERLFKDAIDFEAVKDFNEAAQFPNRIAAEIKDLADDKQCGVNGSIKRVGANLQTAQRLVTEGIQIGNGLVAVANSLKPSADEARKIVDELNALASLARSSGPEGQKALQDLQTAINAIVANTGQLLQTDFAKVGTDGVAVVTYIGPFVANCVACATTISGSVGAMVGGISVAAPTTAACASGVGCALPAVSGISAAVGGAVGGVLSSQPCQAAASDSAKLKENIDRIQQAVDSTAKLVAALPDSIDKSIKASEALVKLAEQLGRDAEPRLKNIQMAINKIIANAEAAGDQLEKQVAPRITKLSGTFLKELSEEVTVLGICYNKLLTMSGSVSREALDSMADLAKATSELADAGKVVENASRALDDGKTAMVSYLNREHAKLAGDIRELHRDVWGVNPGIVDPGKSAQHLIGLIGNSTKVNGIAKDAAELIAKEQKIIERAVDAGKEGFLNGPKLQPAKAKYAVAKAKIAAAKKEQKDAAIASAKAMAKSKFAVLSPPPAAAPLTLVRLAKAPTINLEAAILRAKPKAK